MTIMADSPHAVDSTYHPCCKGIGAHTRDCNPDLPVPAGATAGDWDSIIEGVLTRSLEWGTFDTDKVGVSIDGFQDANGRVTRDISLYGVTDGSVLSADDARALAAKLIEAAAAMDRFASLSAARSVVPL